MSARGPKVDQGSRSLYNLAGRAGCVALRKSRLTGSMVGLYAADEAGMDCDPEAPWVTVCEEHSTLVSHDTLKLARSTLPFPDLWCGECADATDAAEKNITK